MLSTVTYALSKKYTDKAVEKATDGVVDKAADVAADKAVDKVMENITPELTELSADVDQCHEKINENKDFAETIRQGYGRYLLDFKGLRQYIDEEQNPKYTGNGERYIVNDAVRRVVDEDYKCKVFDVFGFKETEYVFDAYCKDIRQPIAVLCLDTSEISDEIPLDQCVPIYATKVGPINKTIILDRLRWEFPTYGLFLNGCRIILNSYQSEPILYHHKFDKVNVYTKDETDAEVGAVAQDVTDLSGQVDTLEGGLSEANQAITGIQSDNESIHNKLTQIEADMFIVDKERDPSNSWSGKKYIFSNNILTQVDDGDYECKMYLGLNIANDEWVFDAYCTDVNVPVAILCPNGSGDSLENCKPIYAKKVGPVDKTIFITKEDTGYSSDACIIILNSYKSEPTLYEHRLDVYTREGTDAAIANAINSAITDVINTAY